MRRRLGPFAVLAAALALTLGIPAAPATAAPPASFVFAGGGFGHGVGMSQYGAYGQALEGRSVSDILRHYYTGVTVDAVDDSAGIRANLVHAASGGVFVRGEALQAGAGTIQIVVDGVDPTPPTTIDGTAGEQFVFNVDGTNVTVSRPGQPPLASGPKATVLWSGTPTLLNVAGPGETFETGGHRYRYGLVDVVVVGTGLEVVNELRLHGEYLRGIAEMPSSWPAAALEAQAIAARTYALRRFQAGQRPECRCHVYDTVADQVFAGWVKEADASGGPRWVAAVEATSPSATTGVVVRYNGALISANYFSSSAGRTENNEDGFGGSPLPYLRSVDDPWSLRSYNPRASWSFTKTQADVAAAFNLPDVVSIDLSARSGAGLVKRAVGRASTGATATITGSLLRSRLGLPSAWLRKPVTRLAGDDRFATGVAIAKVAAPNDGSQTGGAVVLASGDAGHLVDGLVAAPLARHVKGPLLLSAADSLPAPVAAEVERRRPTTAYLVGGLAALGQGVEDGLKARGVTTVTRLAGDDRYGTGLAVARQMGGTRQQAVIASGEAAHLVDALAAGGPAAATGRPILLVSRDEVPAPTRQALTELGTTSTVVVGGTSAVSDATMAQLPSPHRDAGTDRYGTALAVADDFSGLVGVSTVVVASAQDANLVDSLAGGSLGLITVLTARSPLTTATRDWLRARPDIGAVHVLGGTAAVADATLESVRAAVGG